MKKILLTLAVAAMASQAWAITGNDLVRRAEADERVSRGNASNRDFQWSANYLGFVAGVADLLSLERRICLPESGDIGQFAAVVHQYLRQSPAQLHRPGSVLVRDALVASFPCR